MRMTFAAAAGAALWLAASALPATAQQADEATAESEVPTSNDVLFWTEAQRDYAFRRMEDFVPSNVIEAGDAPLALPAGDPLDVAMEVDGESWDVDRYMEDQRAASLIVIHNGEVRLERYRMGADADTRWTSFSVAKSLTSTLVGAAIEDGYIESLDTPVTRYIPELEGSGYDGVTIRQLLTMTSGVRWNEDYTDPNSDVARFNNTEPEEGVDPIVTYMRTLEREAEPGTRWQYNTGETNLIGVLVRNATGRSVSEYLSEKVWRPFGMEHDAVWLLNGGGREISGCCISATVRDFARFGMFVLTGGNGVVPDGWFGLAGSKHAEIGIPGRGYGYQWWTFDDGSFAAQGIFGQGIFIDHSRNLVIASNGDWPVAVDIPRSMRRNAFYRAVQAAIDAEEE